MITGLHLTGRQTDPQSQGHIETGQAVHLEICATQKEARQVPLFRMKQRHKEKHMGR